MKGSTTESQESMSSIRAKFNELRTIRKNLQDQISRHDTEEKYAKNELERLKGELERRQKSYNEKQEKLLKYEDVLKTSEAALQRLLDTTSKLDTILGEELNTIKSPQKA